jgi:hypothetical protein
VDRQVVVQMVRREGLAVGEVLEKRFDDAGEFAGLACAIVGAQEESCVLRGGYWRKNFHVALVIAVGAEGVAGALHDKDNAEAADV